MPAVVVVVPCYNEERRLAPEAFLPLLERADLSLLFVNDGSTDGTERRLRELVAAGGPRVQVLSLAHNAGKGEAVRRGMRHALERGARAVGYLDADGSTPWPEAAALLDALEAPGVAAVLGARVALLGRDIRRRAARHYVGRVFATFASIVLDLVVYDTQCGAKFFRDTPALRAALAAPFASRWAFDVELLGRLLLGARGAPPLRREEIIEVPLRAWHDVAGSKLGPAVMVRSGLELALIAAELRSWKRAARGGG